MTALDAIKRAMRLIGQLADSETPKASEAEDGLAALNAMLAEWEGQGIRLGLPRLALTDTFPLPATHDNAIVYNLAIDISPEYGASVSPAVAKRAADAADALRATYAFVPEMACELELLRVSDRWRRRI